MTQQKNKRATAKSAKKDSPEKQAYNELVRALATVLTKSANKKITKKTLADASAIVAKAVANASSIYAARKRMKKGTSRRQVAKALSRLGLERAVMEINKILRTHARKLLGKKPCELSMDLHESPYHGEPFKDASEIRGGKQKDGTRRFHTYATAYVNNRGKRITIGIVIVRKGMSMQSIIRQLLYLTRLAGIQTDLLLLDKGFFSVDVFRLLKRLNIPFIMPLKGKRLEKKRGSYKTFYTVKTASGGILREERLRAYSVIKKSASKKADKKQVRQLCYVSWGVSMAPKAVSEKYRKRFGIESSYKLSKKARPRTSSRNPAYRAFLFAASFFFQNIWVFVKKKYCWRMPRWAKGFISLRDFGDVILAVIREAYGEAATFASPP